MSQESRCNLAESSVQSLFLDCNQDVSWLGFSSEGWSGEGCAFKFTDTVVKRLWVLPDRWPEFLSDCYPGAILSSLLHGPPHHGDSFHQSQRGRDLASRTEVRVSCDLSQSDMPSTLRCSVGGPSTLKGKGLDNGVNTGARARCSRLTC